MAGDLLEPHHPDGRELNEIERCLFCLYLVAVEAKRCAEVFLGPEDRKHDGPLIFTVINHAGIILTKFAKHGTTSTFSQKQTGESAGYAPH